MKAPNARERVRLAIKARLDEIGLTQRDFGRRLPSERTDQWVSNLLRGSFALSLEELDEAAMALRTTPTELVKRPDDEAWILGPSERRLVRLTRQMPPPIRQHLIDLVSYLAGVLPEEVEHLQEYRLLDANQQAHIRHWVHVLRLARTPELVPAPPSVPLGPDVEAKTPTPRTRDRKP